MIMESQKPVLLSTAYMPPVSYCSLLLQHPVIIEKNETYSKQSYRNRCHIYSDKGMMTLSIPVEKPQGNHTLTSDVQIFNHDRWFLKHWRALLAAYESSPYFLYYKDELAPFFQGEYDNLFDYNLKLIQTLCELIGIKANINYSEQFEKRPEDVYDLRSVIHPKQGKQRCECRPYVQVFNEKHGFIPDLSILDALFNMGPQTHSYLSHLKFSAF